MGGQQVVPVVHCGDLRSKVREENELLCFFIGALRSGLSRGHYRLGDEKIVQDLKAQKMKLDQVLKMLESGN